MGSCEGCHMFFCRSCPIHGYEKEEAVYTCSDCGFPILEGMEVFNFGDDRFYCENCVSDRHSITAEKGKSFYELLAIKMHNQIMRRQALMDMFKKEVKQ